VAKLKSVRRTIVSSRAIKKSESSVCEEFCRRILEKGAKAISPAVVERALSMAQIPFSATRKNVIPKGQEAIRGAVCGLFVFVDLIGVSSFSRRFPWFTKLLAAFCHKEQPGFKFTSIQVNLNYASRAHVDRNNLGQSFIIGLGKYTGGALWLHQDDGNKPHTLDEDITLSPMYKKGDTHLGRDTNIHNRWVKFDGNRLHLTRPFHGTRYSLVYFTCDRYAESSLAVREDLKGMGFPFRWESVKLQKMLVSKRVERQRIQQLFAKERNSLHQGVVPQLLDADHLRYESENPKKFGCNAYKRYKRYSRARTVGEAVRLGALAIDLIFDYNHGYMHVVGLNTRPADWDLRIKDLAGSRALKSARADLEATALGEGDSKMVKIRVGEMNASHKGLDVPRKSLAALAARVSKLRRVPDARWTTEASPTAKVPLAALRALLQWAASGCLTCKRGSQQEAIRAAFEEWGERSLAARVEAAGEEVEDEEAATSSRKRRRPSPAPKAQREIRRPVVKPRMKLRRKEKRGKHLDRPKPRKAKGCPKCDEPIRFAQENPKLGGSKAFKRYAKYKKARTVKQALDLGADSTDIRWDFDMGFCKRFKRST
jgi:hypothetical protein